MGNFDARLDTVPKNPGVYLMKDTSGSVIYVGKAKNLRNRLTSYFGNHQIDNPKVRAMVSHVADFEYVVVGTEPEAFLLEANLIKRYKPHYNILLRDDKGYPYVCITMNEAFPRVFKSFRIDTKLQKEGALYFGPYMGGDLYNVLKAIDQIFPLKKCSKKLPRDIGKERPCLNYHIGTCLAPCNGGINAEEYLAMTNDIVDFFKGRYDSISDKIKKQMEECSEKLEFEKAAQLRNRYFALTNITAHQRVFMNVKRDVDAIGVYFDAGEVCIRKIELREGRVVGSSTYFFASDAESVDDVLFAFIMQYYDNAPVIAPTITISRSLDASNIEAAENYLSELAERQVKIHIPERGELNELQKLADLNAREMMVRRIMRGGGAGADPKIPLRILEKLFEVDEGTISRIESYDISNMGNDDICSGMVVFTDGTADRKSYRLFKMKTVLTQDDFASMRETLLRRFSHDGTDGFKYPDAILLDGGKGQLSAVCEVLDSIGLKDKILIAGMFKNNRHKTAGLVFPNGNEVLLDKENLTDEEIALLRFLTAIQNEVHRFANSYRKKLSAKRNIKYTLEEIEGIGPAKRKKLLSYFGTIKAVSEADKEALMKCPSISEQNAEQILKHFGR